MDARVNTVNDPSTSDKNMVTFGAIIPEFCKRILRRAGYTLGFATHF